MSAKHANAIAKSLRIAFSSVDPTPALGLRSCARHRYAVMTKIDNQSKHDEEQNSIRDRVHQAIIELE
jgi:hypothetical protein